MIAPGALDTAVWPIFHAMTERGIVVDTAVLNSLRADVCAKIDAVSAGLTQAAPGLEPSKTKSVADWMATQHLFGKRTKTGQLATGERELAGFHNPVLDKVVEFRGLSKMKNTFIDPILAWADDDPVGDTLGLIHPRWRVTKVKSGRVSMEDPNLLAFPSRDDYGKRVKEAFVARPGHLFVSADYSQLEPRIVAALSQDPTLLEIFATGRDLYAETATRLSVSRMAAKTITLGVLYGMMAKRLFEQLILNGCVAPDGQPLYSEEHCARLIEMWFETYPGVKELVDRVVTEARAAGGWASTEGGRRRFLPALFLQGNGYPNEKLRQEAERQAFNHRIQGTGMEMLKQAMLRISALKSGHVFYPMLAIHDELIYEVPAESVEACKAIIHGGMCLDFKGVFLKVTVSHGPTWASLK